MLDICHFYKCSLLLTKDVVEASKIILVLLASITKTSYLFYHVKEIFLNYTIKFNINRTIIFVCCHSLIYYDVRHALPLVSRCGLWNVWFSLNYYYS